MNALTDFASYSAKVRFGYKLFHPRQHFQLFYFFYFFYARQRGQRKETRFCISERIKSENQLKTFVYCLKLTLLVAGHRFCLVTKQNNCIQNKIYIYIFFIRGYLLNNLWLQASTTPYTLTWQLR